MRDKKHILFISSWYPNRNNHTHGIFNRYFAQAAALHNKVSVLHVCSDENVSADFDMEWQEETGLTTLIVYYKKVKENFPGISQLKKHKLLIRAFEMGYEKLAQKNGTPDLMQLNVIFPAGLGVQHLFQKYKIPYVINEGWSGYCPEDGNYKGLIQKFFTKRIAANAEFLMPVSEHLKKAMLSHGLNGNYVIVPNIVDLHLFVPQPKPISKITSYIHISGLDEVQKNVSGIIRAFATAHKTSPDTTLTIIGDGPEKKMLQQLVNNLNIANAVIFKGSLKIEQVVSEINASDVLVMFSNYETFSLVVAEAFACGKPVITSRSGGLTDFITPDLGITVEKKNEIQLAQALLNFVTHKTNYDSKHIRAFVEDYSIEKIGAQLNGIYEKALKK